MRRALRADTDGPLDARRVSGIHPAYADTNCYPDRYYDHFTETNITEDCFVNASEAVHTGLSLLERQAAEDAAKLEWLRTAAKQAFSALDRGEGIRFGSLEDLDAYVKQIGTEVSARIAAERDRA